MWYVHACMCVHTRVHVYVHACAHKCVPRQTQNKRLSKDQSWQVRASQSLVPAGVGVQDLGVRNMASFL